jgi:hypothetical protein
MRFIETTKTNYWGVERKYRTWQLIFNKWCIVLSIHWR